MANAIYTETRDEFLTGTIDLATDDVDSILVDTADYTVNLSTHTALDDVAGAARVATFDTGMTSKTIVAGTFDAADLTWSSVTGDTCEAIIDYIDSGGAESSDTLLFYLDTASSGLPLTPNGGDVVRQNNASGILVWS